jgi:hypothetical protein
MNFIQKIEIFENEKPRADKGFDSPLKIALLVFGLPGLVMLLIMCLIPTYRYIVDGKLYVSTPALMSNLPGFNPVAGPCTIRVKKNKPWKMISPLRHYAASILYALALGWLILPGILSLADADFQKILHPASENVSIIELMNEMKPSN